MKKNILLNTRLKILIFFIFSFLFLTFTSCSNLNKEEYQVIAEQFIKKYYQAMNQEEAIKLTDLMAKDKLSKEIELVKEARAKNPKLDENKSKVTYSFLETTKNKDSANLTYKLTIQPKGGTFIERTSLINMKKINSSWKIIDFEETNFIQKDK
ncbi:MAG: hypothetical protein U0457_03090 [Candidatus Sericytochromatia bacterium]